MAATYAKGLPQAVSAFAQAADRLTPEQQQQHDFAALQSSFRADASSSLASASDFSRFAQHHAGPSSSAFQAGTGLGQQHAAAWERSQLVAATGVSSAIPAQSNFASSQDGDALVALLNGHESVVDAVDGDWERELAQDQQRSSALVSPLPADPLASKSDSQQPDTRRAANPGDMSPTSESLLASVSNLSLAEQTYLRTLLASQDPAAMFQDYFSHGTYTDDVWTPITSGPIKDVLDRAAQDTGKGKGKERLDDDEGGKAKAVRRLEMLLRHLNGQIGSTAAVTSPATSERRAGRLGGAGNAANHLPNSTALSSVADPRAASDESAHAFDAMTATSSTFTTPSSLSSSAFVSFSPPQPVAVHSPATLEHYPHQPHPAATSSSSSAVEHIDARNPLVTAPYDRRPATQPRTISYAASSSSGESNGTDASYEEYAKEKEARMRSNEGGRFGPDFSSMRSLYGSGAGGEERGGEAMADVTEGRTH